MSLAPHLVENFELINRKLSQEVSPIVYRNWIAPLKYCAHQTQLTVLTLDDFHTERIKKEFLVRINEIVSECFPGRYTEILVNRNSVSPTHGSQDHTTTAKTHLNVVAHATTHTEEQVTQAVAKDIIALINSQQPPPRSKCNDLFMRVIEDLAEHPNKYDSIYISGPAGSGKSTYTQYLSRCLTKVLSLSTGTFTMDEFTSEMVEALQSQSIYKFRKKFKENYKAIIIDDFHLIAKRSKTQEELAHMVHSWKADGIKVVFISQLPLEACVTNTLLLARIQSGLVVPVEAPDFSLIEQMVINELNDINSELRHHIINFCHEKISSLHTLKGILNRVRVEVGLCKRQLDQTAIENIVDEFVTTTKEEEQKPKHILSLVCQYFQVDEDALRSRSRKKMLSEARRLAAYLLRKHSDLSLMDIGSLIGRDHTTVLHAIQKVEEEIKLYTPSSRHLKFFEQRLCGPAASDLSNQPVQQAITLH